MLVQLSKIRLERIQKWRDRAKQLSPQEEKLRASMPEHARKILSCKRTLLLQEMAAEIDWPDQDFFTELREGFRLVGCLKPSGIFRPRVTASALNEDELMAQSGSLNGPVPFIEGGLQAPLQAPFEGYLKGGLKASYQNLKRA